MWMLEIMLEAYDYTMQKKIHHKKNTVISSVVTFFHTIPWLYFKTLFFLMHCCLCGVLENDILIYQINLKAIKNYIGMVWRSSLSPHTQKADQYSSKDWLMWKASEAVSLVFALKIQLIRPKIGKLSPKGSLTGLKTFVCVLVCLYTGFAFWCNSNAGPEWITNYKRNYSI